MDPLTLERVPARWSLTLVEPNGCEYLFDARSLAKAMLCGSSFLHPVTRRELLPVEVKRLARLLPPEEAALLVETHRHCGRVRRFLAEQQSLSDFLEGEVSVVWQDLLADLTHQASDDDLEEVWEEYSSRILRVHAQTWGTGVATTLVSVHAAALERRAFSSDDVEPCVELYLQRLRRLQERVSPQIPPQEVLYAPPAVVKLLEVQLGRVVSHLRCEK